MSNNHNIAVTSCTICGMDIFEEDKYICDKCEEDIKNKYESEEDEEQEIVKHKKLVKKIRKFDR